MPQNPIVLIRVSRSATNCKDRWNKFVGVLECISWCWKVHFHRCALQPFIKELHGLTLRWLYVVTHDRMNWVSLTRAGPQHKMEKSWTACKSKSSFLSCEGEFSAIISFKTRVFALEQFGIVIRFDNLDQNKPLTNRCASFRSRDIIW